MLKRNILKTATVRNARLCNATENFGHSSVFNVERQNFGWDFVENGTLFGVSGGFAFLSATISSPSLSRSTPFLAVDASINTEIALKIKYKNASEFYTADKARIMFTTSSDLVFTQEKSVEFDIISDDVWHVYRIDMAPVFKWIGFVNNLKIVFADEQGIHGDEIFIEYIRIQSTVFNFCVENCTDSQSTVVLSDSFDDQNLNTEPQNWATIDTFPGDRSVGVVRDSNSLVNKVVSLINATATGAGPAILRSLSEPVDQGTMSFRFRPSSEEGLMTLYADDLGTVELVQFQIEASGKLQFREGLSTFKDFEVEAQVSIGEWNEVLVSLSLSDRVMSVFFNGELVDSRVPYIFVEPLKAIRFDNQGSVINSFDIDDVLVIKVLDPDNLCPGIGRQGDIQGVSVSFTTLDIEKGINDTLIVNLNNFGDVVFNLPITKGATREDLRRMLEKEISSLDLGGYPYSEVDYDIDSASYRVKSGTYGFDSTVEIKVDGNSLLARQLGFRGEIDEPLYVFSSGRPHAANFEFSNNFTAKTSSLLNVIEEQDDVIKLFHNPQAPVVEIGSPSAGQTSRLNTLNGIGKTFIDFYHRATEEGRIDSISFHGELPRTPIVKFSTTLASIQGNRVKLQVSKINSLGLVVGDLLEIDESGYSGNGFYVIISIDSGTGSVFIDTTLEQAVNLNIVIQTVAKIKHLRPDSNGDLSLVNETVLGEEVTGQLYSRRPDTYQIPVNWYLHRGDFVGIYNAQSVYVGNDLNSDPEALFVEYAGDLLGTKVAIPVPIGNGIRGIGLHGRSDKLQNRAVYDISFAEGEAIEFLEINGTVFSEEREYNLLTAVDSGLSLDVTITGTHVHKVFDTLNSTFLFLSHDNIPYNVFALSDGVKFASNGLLGAFEQTVPDAAYFYVSGDGEFTPTDAGDPDAIEFPNGTNLIHEQIQEYYGDDLDFDLTWNVPKTVHRYKMYFKDYPNVDNYSIEWFKKANKEFDGTRLGFERIGLNNEKQFTSVSLDKLILHSDSLDETQEFIKHFQPVFDAHIDSSNPEAGGTRVTYERNPFTVLDKEFEPLETTAVRWHCGAHRSTKISEIELYSKTNSTATLEESLELFFSTDGETFQKAKAELLSDGKVRFDIGVPVRFLRLISNPGTLLGFKNIIAQSSDDSVRYADAAKEKAIDVIDMDIKKGELSPATKVSVTNADCFTSSAEISIDTVEISDSVVLKTGLHSEDEVLFPEIGPKGITYFDPNVNFRVTDNVAVNAKLFKLVNLAANARFYEANEFKTESDYFRTGLLFNKWIGGFYENFPGTTTGDTFSPGGLIDFGSTVPGFNMESGTFPPDSPGNPDPNKPVNAEVRSKWNVTGSFSAFVEGRIDPRGTNAAPRSIILGIVDATGREISIEKEVHQWKNHSPQPSRNKSFFILRDSDLGVVESFQSFELGEGTHFGSEDYSSPFVLKMNREVTGSQEVFTFSFVDGVNGTGELEWGGEQNFQHISSTPLVAPIKVFLRHYWRMQPYFPGGVDGTLGTPHNRILSFNYSGSSTYTGGSISFGGQQVAGSDGEVGKDNRQASVTNDDIRAIAVDLGNTYALDTLQNFTVQGLPRWNSNLVEFSNSQVGDPNAVEWGNSGINNVRWLLFKEDPVPLATSGSSVTYLDTLRIFPDITIRPPGRLDNSEWTEVLDTLTDGDSSTFLTQLESPVFALDLGEPFQTENYFLLDRRGEEFSGRIGFEGWDALTFHTQASTQLDDPKRTNWSPWTEHDSSAKTPDTSRWHAFKNDTFDTSDGTANPRYAASFRVSTLNFLSSGTGEFTDVVDFTEFAQWFTAPYRDEVNEGIIVLDDVEAVGLLYDSSPISSIQGVEAGEKSFIFDDQEVTSAQITTSGEYFAWRVFGTPSGTVLDDSVTISGISLPSTGENVGEQSVTLSVVDITSFEVTMSDNSLGYPGTIVIQTLSGSIPSDPSHWNTISTESGLVQEVTNSGTDFISLVFNGGEAYRVNLAKPTTISGFKVIFEDLEYGQGQELRDITVQDIKALRATNFQGADVIELSNDVSVRSGGRRSLKLKYKAGNSETAKVTAGGAIQVSNDPQWSIQDYLKIHLKIDNVHLLDLENCFIKLGTDESFHYSWSLSSLQGDLSSVELNSYLLRFKDAVEQGIPGITINSEDRSDLESRVNFKEGPIQFVQVELKPLTTAVDDISVWLDNFSVEREKFNLQGQSGNALYLNNGELLYYPISDFDISKGFFEGIITPDWDREANTSITKLEAFTLFTAVNSLDESFSCIYSTFNTGLVFTVGTKDRRYNFIVGRLAAIERYEPVKISVAWDSQAESLDTEKKSTIRVWVNDQLFMDFTDKWETTKTKNNYFFIGSKAPAVDLALNIPLEYSSVNPAKIVPEISSITGGIENIILNREPVKVEFQDLKTLKDKILISVDGVTFYDGTSEVFPITVPDIDPGESFDLWVKTNFPENTRNMSRKAFLRTRWRRS